MPNSVYPKAKEKFLGGGIDLDTAPIKVALVSAGASYNSAHEFWSSLSANVVGTPATLTSVTVSGGVFNAANVTFTAVTGSPITALVIFQDTGTPATSPLVSWIDTTSGGPVGVTPSGGNVVIAWDTGVNKIFSI